MRDFKLEGQGRGHKISFFSNFLKYFSCFLEDVFISWKKNRCSKKSKHFLNIYLAANLVLGTLFEIGSGFGRTLEVPQHYAKVRVS